MHYRPAGSGTTSIAETTAGCVGHALTCLPVEPAGRGPNRRKLRNKDGVRSEAPVFA